MPNIRLFDSAADLQPTGRAASAAARAGNAEDAAFTSIGKDVGQGISDLGGAYVKFKTNQDISQGLAQKAQILDNLTTAWDVTIKNADPNDHATAERFREEQIQPLLDQWSTSFSTEEGKSWATEQVGQMRQHFFEKTAADQSLMAGQAVVQNIHDFTTGMSNTVMQDPSALNMALGTADAGVEAMLAADPNITPKQAVSIRGELRDNMRQEIAKSAFIGAARAAPDQAMASLADPNGPFKHLLDGTTQNQMFGFAESIKRAQVADARAAKADVEKTQKDNFDRSATALQVSVFQPDGSIAVPPNFHQQLNELALMPGSDPSQIRALGDAAARATEASINGTYQKTDNPTWQGLASRIGQPAGSAQALTHTQVDQAYAAGKLSNSDWRFLNQSVNTTSDPAMTAAMRDINQALERNKALVTKSNLYSGKLDQSGDQLYDDLHFDTFQRFQALQAQGMSATEAAKVITDPRNPQGIQANLAPYQTNNKQGLKAIHDRVSAQGGPSNTTAPNLTEPRKAGESAADFLKRTGG